MLLQIHAVIAQSLSKYFIRTFSTNTYHTHTRTQTQYTYQKKKYKETPYLFTKQNGSRGFKRFLQRNLNFPTQWFYFYIVWIIYGLLPTINVPQISGVPQTLTQALGTGLPDQPFFKRTRWIIFLPISWYTGRKNLILCFLCVFSLVLVYSRVIPKVYMLGML